MARAAALVLYGLIGGCGLHWGQQVSDLPAHAAGPPVPAVEAAHAHNVVLFIGDGMGAAQVAAASVANGGALHLDRFPVRGLARTGAADDPITDSAAAATAMATGHKTRNHAIGVDAALQPVETLLERAETEGRSTGIVATCDVTHATPASFVAHVPDRGDFAAIAPFYLSSGVDVVIGGGASRFGPEDLAAWRARGAALVDDLGALADVPAPPAVALVVGEHLPRAGRRPDDWLLTATLQAVRLLDTDPDGFFLVVEGSQIDWGGHRGDATWMVAETLDLDRAVGGVLDWAARDGETLVVVTADHETGGFEVLDDQSTPGHLVGRFATHDHTPVPVPVYAYGPGAAAFSGTYENAAIHDKILAAWDAVQSSSGPSQEGGGPGGASL